MFLEIIRDLSAYQNALPMVISLGMYDGVHRGHLRIIERLNKIAKEKNYISAVFSFWPHPRKVINPEFELQLLTDIDEKKILLEEKGLDFLFLQEFDDDFKNLEPEDFVEKILVKKLNVQNIIIGHDHCFGKNRRGDVKLLKTMSEKCGFVVEELDLLEFNHQNISSTKIREALKNGQIKEANKMLGYAYSVLGEVVHGKKIGRTIGYPTANIAIDKNKLLPKKGAYIVEVWKRGQLYKGMLSIGTNPTVGGKNLTMEVYILDFEGDIYGEKLMIKFRDFLHEEIKFENLEKLIKRLDEDKKITEKYFF